jgi:GTP-binding nuclear protein Ran
MNYNIVLLGNSGVGKSSFLSRHTSGHFVDQTHYPAIITLETNHGTMTFTCWENSYQSESVDGVIVLFDVTNIQSFEAVSHHHSNLSHPLTILCGNKCDEPHLVSPPTIADLIYNPELPNPLFKSFHLISAKSNYNYDKPFLSLAKYLTGFDDISFT